MLGLANKTEKIFKSVSLLDCIKGYTFIGGTALAMQINKRQSEDLDFCIWSKNIKKDKPIVDWPFIQDDLRKAGSIDATDLLGFDHVNFVVSGVRITFLAKQHNLSPVSNPVKILNNIIAADIDAIGAMKIEVMLRRSEFRDYYDLYSILKEGRSLKELIVKASKYSNHFLKTRDVLNFLSDGSRFTLPKNFHLLKPEYIVNNQNIEDYIKLKIKAEFFQL